MHSQSPRITLFRSDNLRVTYVPSGEIERLVVTFASWAEEPVLERAGFAEEFLIRQRISAVHVTCAGNDWYQYPEMAEAMAAAARARQSFGRCYTYGLSMGGYAAIRFSGAVGAERAIVIAPQFAIDPALPPFDSRWAREAERIRFIHGDVWTGVNAQVVAIYDNCSVDLRHIVLFRRFVRLFEIPVPHSGHNPARFLIDLGLFQDLIGGLFTDCFDRQAFRSACREKRKVSPEYFFHLSRVARHAPRALALIDKALGLSPGRPQYIAARANILLAMSRPNEAATALSEGIAITPGESWLHHALAIALRRQGRLEAAVAAARTAVRLAPEEREHRVLLARIAAARA